METSEDHDLVKRFKLDAVAQEKWKTDNFINYGGFSEVWRSVSQEYNGAEQLRAVKIVNKEKMKLLQVNYMREVLALATFSERLHNERGVFVTFFGWFEDHSDLFIAMEYFKLGTLAQYITQPIDENAVKDITIDILGALRIMHEVKGFTHRDLTPDNIFVFQKPPDAEQWWVKIGDFGTSKRANLKTRIGKDEYMAPEIHGFVETDNPDGEYDKPVDMWSLGCVIFEMATGTRLFQKLGDVSKFSSGVLKFPEETLQARLSTKGVEFVKGLVVPNPKERLRLGSPIEASWLSSDLRPVQKNRYYGIMAYVKFDPHQHDAGRRLLDPFTVDYRVEVMQWFAQQNGNLKDTEPVITRIPLSYSREVSEGPLKKHQVTIYRCESATPPMYPDSSVSKLVVMASDLSVIPPEEFTRERKADNRLYYQIDYVLVVKIYSASIKVALEFQRKRYVDSAAEYVYQ